MSVARTAIEASRMQNKIRGMIQRQKNLDNHIEDLRQVRNDNAAQQKRGFNGSAGAMFGISNPFSDSRNTVGR
jgi:hypothetical protein